VFKTFKTKLHLCIKQRFRCKLNVVGLCVLPHEFSLIQLHGFLHVLPRPDSQLPHLTWASASLMLPRSRSPENCLTHITWLRSPKPHPIRPNQTLSEPTAPRTPPHSRCRNSGCRIVRRTTAPDTGPHRTKTE